MIAVIKVLLGALGVFLYFLPMIAYSDYYIGTNGARYAEPDKYYAASCKGWNCSVEGQLCSQGLDGADGMTYVCKSKQWEPLYATSCAGWSCSVEGQVCLQGTEGASTASYECRGEKWHALAECQDSNWRRVAMKDGYEEAVVCGHYCGGVCSWKQFGEERPGRKEGCWGKGRECWD